MSELDEQKKLLLPILQRATEIEAMEPKVAYYCRLYALKRALELPKPAEPIQGLIKALFTQCEKDKPKVQPKEDEDREYCRNFALTVFNRADKLDRAGRADINTAKCFYAAAIFLQVLEQFLHKGEEFELAEPEAVEKARYALWRAAELRKAMREGRPPLPPPEPADVSAAVAGAAAEGAYGSSGGGGAGGDLFAGPAFESGGGFDDTTGQQQQQQQQQPAAPPVTAGGPPPPSSGTAVSSTEEFLDLPHPPSTIPPAGSVGLVEPAAAVGPRFRPGAAVWLAAQDGSGPVQGTVGQLVSADGGAGGQALYKVALPHEIVEVTDSQLAPALGAGSHVMFVPDVGERPQPASVIAMQTSSWPCRYLLQLEGGGNLAATGGQLRLEEGPAAAAVGPPPPGAYPNMHGVGPNPPSAPSLSDPAPPAGRPTQQQHQQQHQQPPHRPQPSAPPAAPAPGYSGARAAAQSPPQAAAAAAHGGGPGWSPSAAAALEAAVQAAAAGACQPTAGAVAEAQKYAKFAVSSLNHDDVPGAVKFLSNALKVLMQPGSGSSK